MTTSPYRLGMRGYGTHHALLDLVTPGARLLDVGAAGGYVSALARDRRGARVLAVDRHPGACAESRGRGIETLEGDVIEMIESGELARRGPFDQIMLADVLEHLADPDAPLRALAGMLEPAGSVVVSLPNVAYLRTRLRLARGDWTYEDTGILDRTHLRFFTRATARHMLAEAGFRIVKEIPIGPASYALGRPGVGITRLRPQLLASQFVFRAERDDPAARRAPLTLLEADERSGRRTVRSG